MCTVSIILCSQGMYPLLNVGTCVCTSLDNCIANTHTCMYVNTYVHDTDYMYICIDVRTYIMRTATLQTNSLKFTSVVSNGDSFLTLID